MSYKIISDRFENNAILIGEVERLDFPSVAILTTGTIFLEEENLKELITDLELKLQTIKCNK